MDYSGFFKRVFVIANLNSAPALLPKYIPQEHVEAFMKKKLEGSAPDRKKLFEEDPYFIDLAHISMYQQAEAAEDREDLSKETRERNTDLCKQGWKQALYIRSQAAQGVFSEELLKSPRLCGIMQEMRLDTTLKDTNSETWKKFS